MPKRTSADKWTSADLPQMDGRTVVITGAGSGIGLIAARELARARVIAAVRDPAKARAALAGAADPARSGRDPPARRVRFRIDRAFADAVEGTVDVLVNNAGVMDIPRQRTAGGFDLQTATNYFGPFVLTNLLADRITDRVVSVTSQLHRRGRLDLGDLDWRTRAYDPMRLLRLQAGRRPFSLELQRRLTAAGRPVRSVLAHPGIATTTLAAHSSANRINRLRFLLNDPEHGALPTLYAATQDVPANAYVGPDGLGSIRGYPVVRRPARLVATPRSPASSGGPLRRSLVLVPWPQPRDPGASRRLASPVRCRVRCGQVRCGRVRCRSSDVRGAPRGPGRRNPPSRVAPGRGGKRRPPDGGTAPGRPRSPPQALPRRGDCAGYRRG